MCNLYSITTNQAAIIALFRVINRYVGNLQPMPGVFPDYPAPLIRNAGDDREMVMMRWGMPSSGLLFEQALQHRRPERTYSLKHVQLVFHHHEPSSDHRAIPRDQSVRRQPAADARRVS